MGRSAPINSVGKSPFHRELGNISRETKKLMTLIASGDTEAMDRVLALSRRREELLRSRKIPPGIEKALTKNLKTDRFVYIPRKERSSGSALFLLALGFSFGLAAVLMVQITA